MKKLNYLKTTLLGLTAFSLLFLGWLVYFDGNVQAYGVSMLAAAAIVFTLMLQILSYRKSEGLQRKFLGLLVTGTFLYAAAELVWFYEEKVKESFVSVPLGSNLLYILNILMIITAFSLLTFAVKNRYQVIYFSIDILIIFFTITTILWVYWFHPLYIQAGVAYGLGVTSFIYPALELLLLFALSATMFVKKYFFPLAPMLLFAASIGLFFIGDSFHVMALYYGSFEPNSLLEVLWSSGLILQGIASIELLRKKAPLNTGSNSFNYDDGAYPALRSLVNIGSIIILFLIASSSMDIVAGSVLLLIIILVYSRQLLAGSQLRDITKSYQDLARDLENQVNKRTEELRKKNTELEKSTSRLKHMALHDQLTDIWNRRALEGRLKTLFEESLGDEEVKFAVIFIDIDKFKAINDSLGHSYGDELLIQFTKKIKMEFPSDAFIARRSGDEFVVLLEGRHSKEDVERIIQNFFAANEEGYRVFGEEVKITFSLGASFFPDDSRNTNELLQAADMAMYAVKQQGRNDYQINQRKQFSG
ncbi:GGDEF domain-containing protein [Bacillus salacetis]|uniref:GGDEF domain-containing protein n=1 Tax=Bacillus salacetis TaxID=2315464 RepID=A0A3A1QX85_9BACI|nr:GGDEF domain-containing protein [Bacillus salacetis]RIW33234.1 GGDEF domain-containing protein [Bacillus salacetis]